VIKNANPYNWRASYAVISILLVIITGTKKDGRVVANERNGPSDEGGAKCAGARRDAEEEKGGRSTQVGEDEEEEDLVPVVSTYLAPRAAGSLGFQQIFSY
jgi:hypothetical protein